jgi:hypothetical protein
MLKLIKWAGQLQDRLKWKDIVEKAKTAQEFWCRRRREEEEDNTLRKYISNHIF